MSRRISPTPAAVSRLPAARLARLLDPALPSPWTAQDAAAALKHQLAAPLLPDLLSPPTADPAHLKPLLHAAHAPKTFRQLLSAKNPHPDLLLALKSFATHARADADSPLQGPPATLLYYAAIAAALVHLRRRITTLPDADLRQGLLWALDQNATTPLPALFRAALTRLTSRLL
ncbi:MAG TPA: hypothetical protein VHQ47_11895 [Phycisphaerae bacterium]|nr:hypothetical protein [Phycisphaerae bacterium]